MIEVITPQEFKTVAWKNGKGETIEMAINSGGTLDDFDWRLSMASVVEDGVFSNFSGYTRNLILIDGDGINLQHNDNKIYRLSNLLDFATFDGGNKTVGNLHTGAITDFNIITRTSRYNCKVKCYPQANNIAIEESELCFIYSLSSDLNVTFNFDESNRKVPVGCLVKLSHMKNNMTCISGESVILVYLEALS